MITVSSAESLPRARSSMPRLTRPVSKSVDADSASRPFCMLELQDLPGIEQEGRQVPFEEGTRGAAGWCSGQQRLTVAEYEMSSGSTLGLFVSAWDQVAAEARGPGVRLRAGGRPRCAAGAGQVVALVHSAGHLVGAAPPGFRRPGSFIGPHPVPQHMTWRAGNEFPGSGQLSGSSA